MSNASVMVCGAKAVKRQMRRGEAAWSVERRATFLDHLAATCNVTHAAALIGKRPASAHALRRRDPAFAQDWADALEQGYAHIEAKLLARAIGHDADPARADPDAAPFDPDIGLRLLALRKSGGGRVTRHPTGPATKRVPIEQVAASLCRKLDALAKRLKVDL